MSEESRDVWVYLQHDEGDLSHDSLELLAAGRKVADKLQQSLVGVVLGSDLKALCRDAVRYGADSVLAADSPSLASYFNLAYVEVLDAMVAAKKPYVFLFTANEQGKDLAARVAYRSKTGLATDNVQLEVEDYFVPSKNQTYKNLLIQIRPDFGTRLARIYTPTTRPQMATVRPGNFEPLELDKKRKGTVEDFPVEEKSYAARVKEVSELPKPAVDLAGADVVICLGMGVMRDKAGTPRNPKDAYDLAVELKRAIEEKMSQKTEIGATRALVYAELKELKGLIGKDNQVGQTGATVSPKLYLGFGVSGALQHRVGMQKSKKIVAVNLDSDAPIFQIAHYPIVGDLYEEIPKLTKLVGEVGIGN